ncbi:zinc ribbon domain-containing protein [Candidatus Laterigemmans baculatus]|uniref:zinc ribbon domain-containing protein n=1 Tax=Candidatus Laterigemmans baculatus TaxID=2770505 RepID=UPI0013DCC4AF|nr:zinc ribbon domain-containing protein [Candidatus Laterigemmans baculatus]
MQFIRRWFRPSNRQRSRRQLGGRSFPCPHCGGDVPAGKAACPACGASDSDGWGDEATGGWAGDSGSGWEDDSEFDYEEFVEREFGEREFRQRQAVDREPVFAFSPKDPKRLVLWVVVLAFAATLLLPLVL